MSRRQASPHLSFDRIQGLTLLSILLFAGVAARLGHLQIFQASKYAALAESQRTHTSDLLPRRGTIFLSERESNDRYPIATTRQRMIAYAVPRDIKDLDATVERLVDILLRFEDREEVRVETLLLATGQLIREEAEQRQEERAKKSPEDRDREREQRRLDLSNDLKRRLGNPIDPYEPIVASYQKLDEEAVAALTSADLPGIELREIPDRYYPESTLASHVLGLVRGEGINVKGEYGIEGSMDAVLQGQSGYLASERDVVGRWISVGGFDLQPARDGADVVLTIDRIVQTIAEKVAKEGRERFKAERASIIVMDPNTGAIRALANYPTFDPNDFGNIRDVSVLKNMAVSDLFEPGSIFKPLVMGIAVDLGLVEPQTTMEDRGKLRIGGFTIDTFDGKHHGTVTMTQILEQSNNIGMVWVAQRIGAEKLYAGLRRFGIGEKTGIEVEGEAVRALPTPDTWSATRLATIGFGQGVVATPLQVLVANATLVNGGKLFEPTIIQEVRYSDGRVETPKPNLIRQVIQPETATKVSAMMTSVVEKGVAQLAKVPGYYVGGKTGTAQVVDPETGRYSPDRKIISFIGFAPAEQPEFIALVVLDNPAGLSFASGTAAPMFRDLARELLDHYRVPPSRTTVGDPLKALRQ